VLALWKSDARGRPSNGGRLGEAYPGRVDEVAGPLRICTSNALHATLKPDDWAGTRVWVVALHGEVAWDGDKCGALKREILGEIK
jgi:hypothetical protein